MPNAACDWCWALNSLKDRTKKSNRALRPGKTALAYDGALMNALPEIAAEYKSQYGSNISKRIEGGVDLRIAAVFEPTCTICGLTLRYQGPGSKTVHPRKPQPKVDFRLVPDSGPR